MPTLCRIFGTLRWLIIRFFVSNDIHLYTRKSVNFRSFIWIFEVFDYLSIQIYVQKTHADNVSENKLYLNAFIIFEVVEVSKIQVWAYNAISYMSCTAFTVLVVHRQFWLYICIVSTR